jgi:hypothetical protein
MAGGADLQANGSIIRDLRKHEPVTSSASRNRNRSRSDSKT